MTLLRLISFVLLLTTVVAQSPISLYTYCGNSTGGKNLSAPYETNLKSLLSWIISDSDTSGGYNNTRISTNNSDSDVYGFYECRGDVTGYFCQFCLNSAVQSLSQRCPNGVSAIAWYDSCIIRYSNESFVGKISVSPAWNSTGTEPIKDQKELHEGLDSMKSLVTKAAEAEQLWDYGEFDWSDGEKRYGVAQCGRDLDRDACKECLGELLDMVPVCCGTKTTWSIMAPSCGMKFDDHRFYEVNGQPGSSSPSPSPAKQEGSSHSKTITIIIVTVLVTVALLIGCGYYFWDKIGLFKDRSPFQEIPIALHDHAQREDSLNADLPTIPLVVIQQTTNHFSLSSKLGEGGFGPVYKGTLLDGTEIAVKRLSETSGQGLVEFKNEVIFIAKLQHRNLVRLLGCCIEENEKLLVYEFMPNSSLDFHLFNEERRKRLDWKLRLSIINGIARGLLYLHEDSRLRVIHRDLKASNVLLDHEMNPKISDFGLARTFERGNIQGQTKRVIGTYGYMAPEYAMAGLFSVKSDVFSFGVLLLEIICGKRNSEFYLSEHGQSLLLHTWRLWCEGRSLELTDPVQENSYNASEVMKCIHIGLLCVQEDAADRPTMSTVVLMLGSETMALPEPKQPAFSVGRMHSEDDYTSKNSKDNSVNEVTVTNVTPR